MIAYVLLIVIAITLSVLTFAYLKLYLPEDRPKCYNDVALSIDSYVCDDFNGNDNFQLDVTVTNRGLFSIQGAFVRLGEAGRIYKKVMNSNPQSTFKISDLDTDLEPGESMELTHNNRLNNEYVGTDGNYVLEIEPLLFIDSKPALCETATVRKDITCPGSSGQTGQASCGDGIVEGNEECDDGNGFPGDHCDSCVLNWYRIFYIKPGSHVLIGLTDGNLGGIIGADQFCNAAAALAINGPHSTGELGNTEYLAWLSTPTQEAKNTFSYIGIKPINTINDIGTVQEVFADYTALTNAIFTGGPISTGEDGTIASGVIWTGTSSDGSVVVGQHCDNWNQDTGTGSVGNTNVANAGWTDLNSDFQCNQLVGSLVCIEKPHNL